MIYPIKLWEAATGTWVEAELHHGIQEIHLADWETKWSPAHQALKNELRERKVPMAQWPQSRHWDWLAKMAETNTLLAHRGFCIVCQGEAQGLMRVDLTQSCRIASQKGKPLVTIEFLEVAPWNQRTALGGPIRYKGVGTVLLSAAAQLSKDEEFGGRIGLYSLPQAENFYRRHNIFYDLGQDIDHQNLRYFETTPESVRRLV